MDRSVYQALIEMSQRYEETMQRLNIRAINLMKSDELHMTLKSLDRSMKASFSNIEGAVTGMTRFVEQIKPIADLATTKIGNNLLDIAKKYSQLIGLYAGSAISDSMRAALESIQLRSIWQLSLSNETDMIHDMIGCFANAKFEFLPSILNDAMNKPVIGAADIAFLKTGIIVPVIERELVYPRGFKTSLASLNKSTAEDIADNPEINYDTKKHLFIVAEGREDSKGLNLVCAFKELNDSDDLFTEVELMNFNSVLATTPMVALAAETGKKIYSWINELFEKQINTIGFDRDFFYHCRSRKTDSIPYTYPEMLKAPHGIPGIGRYNSPGRAHFYFASTQNGAEAEIRKHLKKDEILQTVKLKPVKTIKMLDLSNTLQRGASFLKMIRFPVEEIANNLPRQYLLPGFVGDCCQRIGFDGIKYYGSKEYDNYVSWSDGYFADAGMCG